MENNSCNAPKGHNHPQNSALPHIKKDIKVKEPIIKIIGSAKKEAKLLLELKIISKKFIKCKTLNCPPTNQPNHTNIQVKKQILKYKKNFLFLVNTLLKIKTKAAIEIVIMSKKIFIVLFDQIILKLLLALEEIKLFSLKLFK